MRLTICLALLLRQRRRQQQLPAGAEAATPTATPAAAVRKRCEFFYKLGSALMLANIRDCDTEHKAAMRAESCQTKV